MIKKERYWIEKIIKFPGQFLSKSIRIKYLARSKFTRDNLKLIILLNRYSKMMKYILDQNLKIPFSLACIDQNLKLFSKFELGYFEDGKV